MAHQTVRYTPSHWESLTPERQEEVKKAGHERPAQGTVKGEPKAQTVKAKNPTQDTPQAHDEAAKVGDVKPATDIGTEIGHTTSESMRNHANMLNEALKQSNQSYEPWNENTPWGDDHAHLGEMDQDIEDNLDKYEVKDQHPVKTM